MYLRLLAESLRRQTRFRRQVADDRVDRAAAEVQAGVERAFDQGVAFVRAAVVAGVNGAFVQEQRELPGSELDGGSAGFAEAIELDRPGPRGAGFRG